jgi:hypothetical protein
VGISPTRGPATTCGVTSITGTPATSSMSRCWTSSRAASRSGPRGIASVANSAASMSSSQKWEMLRNGIVAQMKFVAR